MINSSMDGTAFFIRGARILQQLAEATYQRLRTSTDQFVPPTKKRQFATGPVHIKKLQLVPYVNSTDLLARADARNADSGKMYKPEALFLDAQFEDSDQPDNVTFTGADGETYNMEPVNLAQSNVKVKCTCLDFYHRFATANAGVDSLYGNPPDKEARKTENRPPANPSNIPGLCKHLIKMVDELKQSGIVKG